MIRHFGSRVAAAALTLSAATIVVASTPALAAAPDLPQASPKARVEQQVGLTGFTVEYASPGVKGRTVFGGLVPYGEVWRAGANEATTLTATRDFQLGDQKVPAGTYALFTIPGEKSWTVILNSNTKTWGSYGYDQKLDVARIEVKPETLATSRERMTFLFSDTTHGSANLDLEWDKVRVRLPISVDTNAHVAANISRAVDEAWMPHYASARWHLENGGDLKEALRFIDASIAVKPTWSNEWVRAQILAKSGKKKDAVKSAKAAQRLGKGERVYESFYKKPIEAAISDWD